MLNSSWVIDLHEDVQRTVTHERFIQAKINAHGSKRKTEKGKAGNMKGVL